MKLPTSAAVVTGFSVVVALAGWSVSYTTQALLAIEHHFMVWEAWLWPGIADAAALAVMFRLALGQVRPGWYTVEAWVIFTICSALMIGANVVADRGDPMGAAMHGAVPVVAMLVWHLIVHGRPTVPATKAAAVKALLQERAEELEEPKERAQLILDIARQVGAAPSWVRKQAALLTPEGGAA